MPYEEETPPWCEFAQPPEATNQLAHHVIGIAIAVHRELGPGLSESAYENALAIEFDEQGIQYKRQYRIPIHYKARQVAVVRIDFLIEECLILEVKSVDALTPIDRRQVVRYLRITKLPLGLLINFNVMILKQAIHRVFLRESE